MPENFFVVFRKCLALQMPRYSAYTCTKGNNTKLLLKPGLPTKRRSLQQIDTLGLFQKREFCLPPLLKDFHHFSLRRN